MHGRIKLLAKRINLLISGCKRGCCQSANLKQQPLPLSSSHSVITRISSLSFAVKLHPIFLMLVLTSLPLAAYNESSLCTASFSLYWEYEQSTVQTEQAMNHRGRGFVGLGRFAAADGSYITSAGQWLFRRCVFFTHRGAKLNGVP